MKSTQDTQNVEHSLSNSTGDEAPRLAVTESVATSEDTALNSWRLVIVIGSLCLGIFLLGLDMNIIGVAIPKITTQFNSLDDVAWYGSAYLLAITAFQPLFGNLYKYFNAKPVYLSSITIFEVGSIVCAVATKSSVLIFGRAFLGLGAAGLLQGALAIIGYSVRLDKVPLYQGIVVSALGVSVCIGPVLGGVLTDHVTWRWCFWINVPIGAVVLLCILCFVTIKPSSNQVNRALSIREKLQHMDAVGTVLFLGCITSLLLALQWAGQTISWRDSRIIGLFIGFGLLAILFGCLQIRLGDYATIPVRVLTKRSIYMGALVLFFLGMSSLTYAYYLPIYFQSIQGDSATRSGVRFIALVLPQIVGLVVVGAIVSKWGYYVPYIIAGITVTSIGAGLLTRIDANTRTIEWAAFMVINGLGIGMAQQLPYTALQAVLEPIDVATGNAIAVFSYQLGGQNLFLHKLKITLPKVVPSIPANAVIAAGATGLTELATSPVILRQLRLAYAEAIHDVLIFALAAACMAFPFAWGMQWLNIKEIATERARQQGAGNDGTTTNVAKS